MEKKTKQFEFKGEKYKVIQPNNKIRRESDGVYAKSYREAIQNGFFLEAEIEDILKARGYDEKTASKKKAEILRKMRKLEADLTKKNYKSSDEGKNIAFKIKDLRDEYDLIDAPKSELNNQSANTIAENKRFSFFAYACVQDMDGDRVWDTFEEFENDESPFAYEAATQVLGLIYENSQVVLKSIEAQKSENKWMIENSMMDEDFNFVNSEGKTVDRDGRLIDENANFVDEEGRKVDLFGNLIDSDGNILTEEKPKPKTKTTTKKKTSRKKVTKKTTTETVPTDTEE